MEELIIRGGMIADGTGAPLYKADIAVCAGRIAEIGAPGTLRGKVELDAEGQIVAPGFIDAHAHSDTGFLRDDSGASKLYQGITTEVTGQCGMSPFPATEERAACMDEPFGCTSFDAFVSRFKREGHRMAVNQAMLVGHGSLRAGVIGYEDRRVDERELQTMKRLLRRDLEAGAWGMSLGLEYSPGFFAQADELAELGSVVNEYDGLVTCHMRSEGLKIDAAIGELLQVGQHSGVHVHISHLKIDNYHVHGRAQQVWARIEEARRAGIRVTADMYPFTASCTSLTIRCPKWSLEGGDEAVEDVLRGPRRDEVIEGIRSHYPNAERARTCLFNDDAGCWPQIIGRTLEEVAEELLGTQDYAAAAAEVLVRTHGRAGCIFFVMDEKDMLYFLSKDIGIGSDGWALSGDPQKVGFRPHPRSYATMPEFFRLVREHDLCTMEEAVRRVTGKAADMLGMRDRGRLKTGMVADITVFDAQNFRPRSTYMQPVQTAVGVKHVLIGGEIALRDGRQTAVRAGRFLRKR